MLNLLPRNVRNCEGVSRRSFLQIGALAGLGVSLPLALQQRSAAAASGKAANDTNCILIWTRGGTSHHDTFDPKPLAPVSVRGEFNAISTATPGVHFTEITPNMAKEQKRFALLRGWNPQNGSHGMADQWVMSGRKFNQAVRYPTYGAVVSHYKGFKNAMPPFVQLGTQVDRRFGGGSAGILGQEHNPFEMDTDPNAAQFTVRDITPPKGVGMDRVERRQRILSRVDSLQQTANVQPAAFSALDEHYHAAFDMITDPMTKKAFAMEDESDQLRDAYGRHRFGQSCLLARRLVESGVRFVTVTDGGWDTHANNFKSLKETRIPPIDQALPQLLIDLENRGLLDTTLVVWLTDFGRTPKINSASGRDHWATSGFAVMAGAGVPGGAVLGATDADGGTVIENEYNSCDIATTIYMKLGIPPHLIAHSPDGRPIQLIEGKPIAEWM
ncbi:DUF1501 domain-containing protein [Lignipirellula cremea]|uniref:DUF1501 domain-containing protein n=1 Tax=Lignipirellula cremea TaxID=2528010 RepID=A0A518E283_9BACT|nr:DUF1501 domain-containing protein [Lignipirellula cremea]QDU98162.1 hypothetical protein Pla8534_60230 [Lignipirellula cremea]